MKHIGKTISNLGTKQLWRTYSIITVVAGVRLMRLACETLHDVARHAAHHHDSSFTCTYRRLSYNSLPDTYDFQRYDLFVGFISSL